jgi:hypothetical protein
MLSIQAILLMIFSAVFAFIYVAIAAGFILLSFHELATSARLTRRSGLAAVGWGVAWPIALAVACHQARRNHLRVAGPQRA